MIIKIFKQNKIDSGFSLIEMIIALAIFVIVMVAITGFASNMYRIYYFDLRQSNAIDEARIGVKTMVKEIRRADAAEDGSYVIEDAQDFQFIFYSDVDQDDNIERVRYFIENNFFKRGIIKPVGAPAVYPAGDEAITIVSANVINTPPMMRYFDGDGIELPAPARRTETKLMRLTLEVDVNPGAPPSSFILISEAQLRNIKTNL